MITKVQQYLFNKLPNKIKKNIVIDSNGCWLYQVNINRNGYGRIYDKGKRVVAHKFMYKFFKGSYDESLFLDHVYCNDRKCCNPTHVSPVTHQQNVHRGKAVLFRKVDLY